ncbi:signal peptidase I [Fructilactobacillus myrtifloralis]|uniref:Signal peptidase I n=1 Tax=Fructilactobacillus myrtifloralis TaxID=2940301 RepID=A0ABY5BM25_9LACO|nr:signal peptidase I [Fructilactobacillus myrtifloralis]USS84620.1 signal peptidase I [Fructilactobacillus myrtifloralis]
MKTFKGILSWVIPIVLGLAIALVIKQTFFTVAKVSGPSMDPNLHDRQTIMVWRQAKPKPGSVIVFNATGVDPNAAPNDGAVKRVLGTAGTDYVKRVIAVPGDTVAFKNNQLYVNDQAVKQPYISKDAQTEGTEYSQQKGNWDLHSLSTQAPNWVKDRGVVKVPKDKYFVLGDNRKVSNDSRYWGFVPKDKIIGVVQTLPFGSNATARNNINHQAK